MQKKRPDFPTFVLWLLLPLVILLYLILHYASDNLFSKDPSEIILTAGTEPMSWIVEKNSWNGAAYDRPSTFVCYERAGLMPNIVTDGDEIKITMGGSIPDSVMLTEFSLSGNSESIYGESKLLREIVFYFGVKSGSFEITPDEEHPVRGYLLTCTWGDNTCEYGFVVQSLPR